MTSKIKVDNINKVSDDSNIINKCGTTVTVGAASDGVRTGADNLQAADGGNLISQSGTTITLGASGDTITLASGASQTGFGRTGTVDWQTGSIKTSTFTAVNGEGYFVNTTGGAITANLPAGSAGAIVSFSDYTRTFATNNLTISPNGSEKIGGVAEDSTLDINGQALTLVYVDATEGWINVQNAEDTETGVPEEYITATGGTITTVDTNFKVHTFTGPGTFTITAGSGSLAKADYLVIAGGGGGGGDGGGGGGGGGFRESHSDPVSGPYTASPLAASSLSYNPGGYPITVGGGGPGGNGGPGAPGTDGSSSIFSTITSTGGGAGGGGGASPKVANPGGSGGGGGRASPFAKGTGNTPSVSPPQGNPGGDGASPNSTGAGGGAGATGGNAPGCSTGAPGAVGLATSITGSAVTRGGGGSGGSTPSGNGSVVAGAGGGGNGAGGGTDNGFTGTVNTGGGGGGGSASGNGNGGNAGSGIVVIRYRFQA